MNWELIYKLSALLTIIMALLQGGAILYKAYLALKKTELWKDKILKEQLFLLFVFYPIAFASFFVFRNFQSLGVIPIFGLITYINLRYWYLHNQTRLPERRIPAVYVRFVAVFATILYVIASCIHVFLVFKN